ncbi:MAG: hypothetical protein ABI650_11810 [Dokdonella sp.]
MNRELDDFIVITEVDRGPAFAEPVFQRKYKAPAPEFPHHVVAFWKRDDGAFVPASYVHFTDCGDIFLAGGACTDGEVLRAMPEHQRTLVRDYGALMLATLRYGFERWGPRCEAIFTCCGDPRALETTPKVGFVATGVDFLLVHWMRVQTLQRRTELIAKARSFMPF